MPETPTPGQFNHEESVRQHREDVERIKRLTLTQSDHNTHLATARDAADTAKHPEVWDEASAEYQAATKVKIAAAVGAEDYETADKLISELQVHRSGVERNQKRSGVIERASGGSEIKRKFLETISESDCQSARSVLQRYRSGGRWRVMAYFADNLRAIDPSFDPETEFTDQDRKAARSEWQAHRKNGNWEEFASMSRDLRAIDPSFDPAVEVTPQDLKAMRAKFKSHGRQGWGPLNNLHFARIIKEIDPSFVPSAEITDEEFRVMRKELQSFRHQDRWAYFAFLASDLQAADPSFNPAIEITDKDRQAMQEDLRGCRQNGYWEQYVGLARVILDLS